MKRKPFIPPRFKHQDFTLKKMQETPILFDMSDPGTGKTRVQIDAFAARRRKKGGKALVLATKSLLESAWKQDFKTYAPDIVVSVAYASNRKAALQHPNADVVVTNHDAVKELVKLPKTFWKDYDTLIIDESTAFKHHTSQRSKAVKKLTEHFKYRTCMSGTPTSNGILDIWHQVFLLDDGKRLGKSFFGFRAAVCNPVQVGPSARMIRWEDKDGADLAVAELLKDIVVRHKFEDCVDIPKNFRYAIKITLPPALQAQYEEMRDFHFLDLKTTGVTAINGAVVYGKLLQIASGAIYDDSGGYTLLDSSRYSLILDLVEEREHSIVFFLWKHQRDELIKEANKRKIKFGVLDGSISDKTRHTLIQNYQKGEYRTLFMHPQSAGHGLTLTKGTATIWASPTYNLEHFLQGLKRIHRIGQTQKTETIVIIAENTIDEKVWELMQRKDVKQSDFINMLIKDIQ